MNRSWPVFAIILFLLSSCAKETPEKVTAPAPASGTAGMGEYTCHSDNVISVQSPHRLTAGSVQLVAGTTFEGDFELHPAGDAALARVTLPIGSTHGLINTASQTLIGAWTPEGNYTNGTALSVLAVLDLSNNLLSVTPDDINMIDIQSLVNLDQCWGMGKGCCTKCVTRPNGTQMCFNVCSGC